MSLWCILPSCMHSRLFMVCTLRYIMWGGDITIFLKIFVLSFWQENATLRASNCSFRLNSGAFLGGGLYASVSIGTCALYSPPINVDCKPTLDSEKMHGTQIKYVKQHQAIAWSHGALLIMHVHVQHVFYNMILMFLVQWRVKKMHIMLLYWVIFITSSVCVKVLSTKTTSGSSYLGN